MSAINPRRAHRPDNDYRKVPEVPRQTITVGEGDTERLGRPRPAKQAKTIEEWRRRASWAINGEPIS